MNKTVGSPEDPLPLSPAVFHILFAIGDGEKHGYAIMREVEESTDGKVRMGPGTLYGAVKKLLREGLIEETTGGTCEGPSNERRRYYRLTGFGSRVLHAELSRMRAILKAAERFAEPAGGVA